MFPEQITQAPESNALGKVHVKQSLLRGPEHVVQVEWHFWQDVPSEYLVLGQFATQDPESSRFGEGQLMQAVDNALVQAPQEVWQFKQTVPSGYLPFGQDVRH